MPESEEIPPGLKGSVHLFCCLTPKFSHFLDSEIGKKGRGSDAFFVYPVAQLFHVTITVSGFYLTLFLKKTKQN